MDTQPDAPRAQRPNIAWTNLFAVTLIIVVMIALLIPFIAYGREAQRRSVCASNLKDMGNLLFIFGCENSDTPPVAPHQKTDETYDSSQGLVDYTRAIGSYRGRRDDPRAGDIGRMAPLPSRISNARNIWITIRRQDASPNVVICPSTKDVPANGDDYSHYWDFGSGDIEGPVSVKQSRQFYPQLSYGYQIPFGQLGEPNISLDGADKPLMADKGPFGAALDGGLTAPPLAMPNLSIKAEDWRPWNSPNHGGVGNGRGQNVLYMDAHARWVTTPLAGVAGDNIYTQWGDANAKQRAHGNPPTLTGRETPRGHTDALIYP
jgi:hypothetical protein